MNEDKYLGNEVKWAKSGRGRGQVGEGLCVWYVESGQSNREALEEFMEEYVHENNIYFRPSHFAGNLDSSKSYRYFILVEDEDSNHPRTTYKLYAPNALEVWLPEDED